MTQAGGESRDAPGSDAGRSCPYCRFALKPGTPVVDCAACSAVHHADCWSDNGGCAVMGCAGAPLAGAGSAAPAPPPARAPAPAPAAAASPPPPAPPRGSRSTTVLAAAIIVLALAVGGTAVAFVLTRKDPTPAGSTVTTPAVTPPAPGGAPTSTDPEVPSPSDAETRASEIHAVLVGYYGAVRNGDYARAWRLLSPTYKRWKTAGNGGYAKWQEQERRNEDRLRVGDPTVRVQAYDPGSSVATIFVSGMRFRLDDGSSCRYEGITWMRRQPDGAWLYDQGYRQNDARAAKWRPRRTETLGYNCESSY